MCRTNCSSNDIERRLFSVHALDILSSLTTPSSNIGYFEQVYYEILFSLKYLFHFFVPVDDNTVL